MIGKTISHYRILEKLGEGGMGVVYKARDTHLDRFVAIKVLPAEKVADPERKRRFVQEAKAASALNHPNIITIYDIDQTNGVDFMAMEYVAGKTLDVQIPRKGLRLNEALKYAVQIADALEAAHAAGIIHRDLKPGNVMVSENGTVTVLDFGLAKLIDKHEISEFEKTLQTDGDRHTDEGTILGTVSYMSPEQAEGKKVDGRSDIFSFGALLYEMVTGRRAFQGDTKLSTLTAILREDPKPPSQIVEDLPTEAERIINRSLRKDPARRWQTMADVRIALQELKEESDSGKLLTASAAQLPRRRSWLWAGGLLALLAISATLLWLIRSNTKVLPVELTAVPLTSYPGTEEHPSFSPDGNQVAFVWNGEKQDNDDIYVKLIGPGQPLRLTYDEARDYSPAWSPDGTSIAFLRDLPGGRTAVLLVPPIGGLERKLTETSTLMGLSPSACLAWSPDGSSLAIVDKNSSSEPFRIFLLSVETGERRKLTSPPRDVDGDYAPAFSPDGRALAFIRLSAYAGSGDLFVQQLLGTLNPQGEPKPILPHRKLAAYNPTWTLDSREIIYGLGIGYGPGSLWRIAADGSGNPRRLDFTGDQTDSPSLSRQRNRLAYTRFIFDFNICRIELAGSRGQASTASKFISSTRTDSDPLFSPDGQKITFLSDRSGSAEIWVCNSDGSHAAQTTSMGGPATGTPRWSPDGQHIAFDSTPDGNWDIFVVAASGGKPRRLTNQPSSEAIPSWSRDGKWIYFCLQSGEPQVWKVPAEGGKAVQVTRKGGLVAFESPDGKFVYYTKSEEGTEGLWRMPVAGGEETQVLDRVIAWRGFDVTDRGIYFLTRSDAEFSIQFFSLATTKTETIAKVERPTLGGLTVSPDGKTILYCQLDQLGSDLMLVENFR